MKAKKVYQSLNEFERGMDPKRALGISTRAKIEDWFEKHAPNVKYEIRDDLTVIVYGNLILNRGPVDYIPDNLIVKGNLDCASLKLSYLPDNLTVEGDLYCENNNLTSLPKDIKVYNDSYFWNNPLSNTLEELPDGLEGEVNY